MVRSPSVAGVDVDPWFAVQVLQEWMLTRGWPVHLQAAMVTSHHPFHACLLEQINSQPPLPSHLEGAGLIKGLGFFNMMTDRQEIVFFNMMTDRHEIDDRQKIVPLQDARKAEAGS